MNFILLPCNKNILDQFSNVFLGIGLRDFIDFIGIYPNLLSPTLEHIDWNPLSHDFLDVTDMDLKSLESLLVGYHLG